ncbi:MAG: hypothetical protein ACRDQ5_17105, partial [Sciscionella sp.]
MTWTEYDLRALRARSERLRTHILRETRDVPEQQHRHLTYDPAYDRTEVDSAADPLVDDPAWPYYP